MAMVVRVGDEVSNLGCCGHDWADGIVDVSLITACDQVEGGRLVGVIHSGLCCDTVVLGQRPGWVASGRLPCRRGLDYQGRGQRRVWAGLVRATELRLRP